MLSLPRSRSLCGRDHRNLANRSTLPPCCKASQTHATCSGEKAREEAALTNSSVRTASVLRSMDNSAASSATSLMHSRLSTSFTFSLLMSFAVVTSPAEEEDIFLFKPSLAEMDDQGCPRCKTTKYRNPSLKLMVNVCGHTLARQRLSKIKFDKKTALFRISRCLVKIMTLWQEQEMAEMQAMSPRGGGGGEASLLSQGPVHPLLTTPFFDLLTAADGKDRSLKL
ncbi:hypothetical protein FQN60_008924 [Etheostoma spectabile]|uniref:Uncharacterized protein n=1 Tax=Etheostoma spectabile TaxID=54343 RepID=A0A5J5CK84_9PERO|nr:hypothetical protein FQN60_008924 [Etheostoma spectabile]